MADLDIAIAGRSYRVACADGEEENLTEAARLVAAEAESLREQFGTRFAALPETRMLLMASLMLGDRFRAHLAEEAAAFAEAPEVEPAPGSAGPSQSGFFDDPVQSARIAELEAALAAARDGEQAALAALEEAAERIRAPARSPRASRWRKTRRTSTRSTRRSRTKTRTAPPRPPTPPSAIPPGTTPPTRPSTTTPSSSPTPTIPTTNMFGWKKSLSRKKKTSSSRSPRRSSSMLMQNSERVRKWESFASAR